jgi:hypothetical protein
MFYIIVFSILAVLLIVAGLTALNRSRSQSHARSPESDHARRQRKSQRAQSRHDRRKRH